MNGQLDIFNFLEKTELREDLQEQKPHRVAKPNPAGDIDFLGEVDETYSRGVADTMNVILEVAEEYGDDERGTES